MKQLLKQLQADFPDLTFQENEVFSWSPSQRIVYYNPDASEVTGMWSLLHEVGHALLHHTDFANDFDLLQMEVAAWTKAVELGKQYGHTIDDDHVQDCLDTYRDWLHQRSTCPTCGVVSLQKDSRTYQCYNCNETWHVAQNRHCRPYRRKLAKQKQPA